jgi:taurine dioxygenase
MVAPEPRRATPGDGAIEVVPLTNVIGAEVRGLDLRRPIEPATRDAVHDALLRHLVLFFRDQDVTEEQQLAFASQFGPPVSASVTRQNDAEPALFVTLEDTPDSPPKADRWHTDVPFVPEPPNLAVLSMRAAPDVGGDTLWASLYGVYERLSPTMQAALAPLDLELDLGEIRKTIAELYGEDYLRTVDAGFHVVRHPLVRVHPETGRPALYLCGDNMRGIAGMTEAESDALLGYLLARLDDPNVQVRWRWEQHDLAMWDERCTNHRAVGDHYPSYRNIRRCLVGGDTPAGVDRVHAGAS